MPSPARLRRSALLTLAAALIVPGTAAAACPDEELLPARAAEMPAYERAIVCLVNEERAQRGRRALDTNSRLSRAGAGHAADMVERGYFSHQSLGGTDPLARLRRAGYGSSRRSWRYGEILAWGTFRRSAPRSIVDAWMASTKHRGAILEPAFDEVGAGAVVGNPRLPGAQGVTVVVEFGRVG